MSTFDLESLEGRTLLAGVTLITHGRLGHIWGFVQATADAITKRLGGPAEAPQYILKIAPDSPGHLAATVTHVNGTGRPQTSKSGEILVLLDYTSIDADVGYPLEYIANVATDAFRSTSFDGVRLAELPFHGISISRGTGLLDELAKAMGKAGIWVDQETYCDPNPVEQMGDRSPTVYDNVAFVDNYWRWDGDPNNFSTNGSAVDGAYNLHIQWVDDYTGGWALKHIVPGGYYVGTIDLTTNNGGEGPIYSQWYGNTPDKPARDQTGFIYSRIVGAARPMSGVWAASGGSGSRVDTGQEGLQWPNVTDLSLASTTVSSGQSVSVRYLQQDRDDSSTVTFFLDTDKNPYTGDFAFTLGTATFGATGSVAARDTSVSTSGVSAGTYQLVARITDGQGHTRYSYGQSVTVTQGNSNPPPSDPPPSDPPPTDPPPSDPPPTDPPPSDPPPSDPPPTPSFARLGSDHVLRVFGTALDDVIKISRSPSLPERLVVQLNGDRDVFTLSRIEGIFVYGDDGSDYIGINERGGTIEAPARLMGEAGNDTLIGASGNDLLFGGDGNDRMYGGAGRDRLEGGLGTDRLYGDAGKDWFVGYKNVELMDYARGDGLIL